MDKKPDLVVWSDADGYDANMKAYPTDLGSPAFNMPDISLVRTEASKKMLDVFSRERLELIEKMEALKVDYDTSLMVWSSKFAFAPIVGHTYFLYNFSGTPTLSLISPTDWNRGDSFIGAYTLTSENKWIKKI